MLFLLFKKVFLLISQNSQESTLFKNTFFYKTPPSAASEWTSLFLEKNAGFSIVILSFREIYFQWMGFSSAIRLF